MSVKLLMNWDIKPGQDQEYFEFLVREWAPGILKLGVQASGAWYTVYSRDEETPQILQEIIAEDLLLMKRVLSSDDWKELHDRLQEYVDNYAQKIVRVTSGDFQF
jgi:hypothetical protein